MGLQGEMAGVDETDVGAWDVSLEGLGPGRQEKRIVPAPYRKQRRPAGPEVLLECRVERHVARIVEEQVELDFIGAAASEVVIVEPVAVRTDPGLVGDTMRVLPDRRLRLQEHPDRFPVGLRWLLPVRLDRVPAVA